MQTNSVSLGNYKIKSMGPFTLPINFKSNYEHGYLKYQISIHNRKKSKAELQE